MLVLICRGLDKNMDQNLSLIEVCSVSHPRCAEK